MKWASISFEIDMIKAGLCDATRDYEGRTISAIPLDSVDTEDESVKSASGVIVPEGTDLDMGVAGAMSRFLEVFRERC